MNRATTATRLDGSTYTLADAPDPMPNDTGHSNRDWKVAYNNGAMNGFEKESGAFSPKTSKILTLTQFSRSTLPHYWAYASTYGVGDAFFASWKGSSFGNNLYQVAAQSGRYDIGTGCVPNATVANSAACHTNGNTVSGLPRPQNMPASGLGMWGCDNPAGTTVTMFTSPQDETQQKMYPCFRFPALPDVMAANGVSWSFYQDAASGHHDSLDAIDSIRNTPAQWAQVKPATALATDLKNGNLPAVSWYLGKQTEHPPKSSCLGENQTVNLVNSVMNSPYWASTAILVTWDEWGGFYDHVSPPQRDHVSYGFRTPFLVISPWTKTGTVGGGTGYDSSLFNSHASLLKFVESNWGLPDLGADDADPSTGSDLMDFFDFSAGHQAKPSMILPVRTCTRITAAQQAIIDTSDPD